MTLTQIVVLREWGYKIKKLRHEGRFLFQLNGGKAYVVEYKDGILVTPGKNKRKDEETAKNLKHDLQKLSPKPVLTYDDWFKK